MNLQQQACIPYNVDLVVRAVQRMLESIPFEPAPVSLETLRELCVTCLSQTASAQTILPSSDRGLQLQALQQANVDAVKLAVAMLMQRTGSLRWQHQLLKDQEQEAAEKAAEGRARLSMPSTAPRSASPTPNRM